MGSEDLSGVQRRSEITVRDGAERRRFGGAADQHYDGGALSEAGLRDRQAPTATRPFRGGETGAGLLADERTLWPEGGDMAVVAETKDAEIEGSGR
jgi:hypothetical protein